MPEYIHVSWHPLFYNSIQGNRVTELQRLCLNSALVPSHLILAIKAGGSRKMGTHRAMEALGNTGAFWKKQRHSYHSPALSEAFSPLSGGPVLVFLKHRFPWGPCCLAHIQRDTKKQISLPEVCLCYRLSMIGHLITFVAQEVVISSATGVHSKD